MGSGYIAFNVSTNRGEDYGRKARLVELDPRYCDVIVARYEAVTGKKAERATEASVSPTLAGVGAGRGS